MSKTKRLATVSVLVSVALVLSFVESRIPAFVAIPGIKVGLANIAVIFALYKLGIPYAAAISVLRILLVSLLFGSAVSLMYSAAGALLSFLVMLFMKHLTPASTVAVSVVGGVCHNIGQILVACIVMQTNIIAYYLPFLLLSGTLAGIAVGVCSAMLIKRIKI